MVPVDVVSSILIHLPVKSLLRFKSVSKGWHSLLNQPYFINLHLHQSIKHNRHNPIIIISKRGNSSQFFSLSLDSLDLCRNPRKIDDVDDIRVVGSCNGLLCFMKETTSSTTVMMWNISTEDHRVLPDIPMELTEAGDVVGYMYGLGHDPIIDDYKFVWFMGKKVGGPTDHRNGFRRAMVYSLRTNTWRRGQVIPYFFPNNVKRPGTLVCGALHWVAVRSVKSFVDNRCIIAFDVRTEKYRRLEVLDNMRCNPLVLGALGGSLCVTESIRDLNNNENRVNLWRMEDYGVKDSWTKMFSFRTKEPWYFLRPLAYSNTQDKFLFEPKFKYLTCYHLEEDELKYVDQLERAVYDSTEICMESLVQLW